MAKDPGAILSNVEWAGAAEAWAALQDREGLLIEIFRRLGEMAGSADPADPWPASQARIRPGPSAEASPAPDKARVDRDAIRTVIAPELERYWGRARGRPEVP